MALTKINLYNAIADNATADRAAAEQACVWRVIANRPSPATVKVGDWVWMDVGTDPRRCSMFLQEVALYDGGCRPSSDEKQSR